jgi:predicted N-formylglutamate amidohydrolase
MGGVMAERINADPWIRADEPPPVTLRNPHGKSPAIVTCDHASAYIPRRLGTLGLEPADRLRHIAWDIGALDIATRLAEHLDAPLIHTGYSRLVVDCNRPLSAPDAFAERSEDTHIPGNAGIGEQEKAERAEAFYWPYHDALNRLVEERSQNGRVPVMICMHTFTPVYRGFARPWHVGVNYRIDTRLARPVLAALRREAALTVGENEPYQVSLSGDYTSPVHAERRGLPHILFEIRQDLAGTQAGAKEWADRLAPILAPLVEQESAAGYGERAADVREPRYETGGLR